MALVGYYRQTDAVGPMAGNVVQWIMDAVSGLSDAPHSGRYLVRRGQAYRAVDVLPYSRVIYRVVGNKVVIVAVWDCRHDSPDGLKMP